MRLLLLLVLLLTSCMMPSQETASIAPPTRIPTRTPRLTPTALPVPTLEPIPTATPTGPLMLYVDTVNGDNTADGLTPEQALRSVTTAMRKLREPGTVGTIRIRAPETAPIREVIAFTTPVTITIEPMDGRWYAFGTDTLSETWQLVDGVYSQPLHGSVPSVLYAPGTTAQRFDPDTDSPTLPDIGRFGAADGVLYLRLPDGASPPTLEAARGRTMVSVYGGASVVMTGATLLYGSADGVRLGRENTPGGSLTATDVSVAYAGSGFAARGSGVLLACTRCLAHDNINDGYNLHGQIGLLPNQMVLIDSEAFRNGDEGASPHDTTVMTIRGGRYYENGMGGVTGAISATMLLDGVTIEGNNRREDRYNWGGVSFLDPGTNGQVLNSRIVNNAGPGVFVGYGATVVVSATISGVEAGNMFPDCFDCAP